ncbi:PQQ-binding-like beta-propeller repeat protein [Glycomyces harbinensis]|uniref:PQQ-like domain-containing protein n=1 Tax=Glycomyces harbinensis TaxID=58114 RepID=A0A1G7B4V0_9ACTN|nr:PQQ-binding-like beta-propeller repeat protein [Glycomyces harbinensis]SDE21336.1 PQQ-like domain-containing protein [Glycomyces harbinensis]
MLPQHTPQSPPVPPARHPVAPSFMPGTPQQLPFKLNVQKGPAPAAGPPRRWIALSVATSLLTAIVITVAVALNQFDWNGATGGDGILGDALDGLGTETDTGEALPLLYEQQLSASGASAVAAADGKAILTEVVDGATVASAVTPEGETLWTQTYELEPTEMFLTVVGDLMIIDAMASAVDEGEDMRAVVSLEDGALLWKRQWTSYERNDVAYYGTELVFEQRDGFEDNAVIRLDLATGEEVWSKPGPEDLLGSEERRVRADAVWGEGAAGTLPPDSHALYDNLTAGDRLVELDSYEGTAVIRDAATGEALTSGALPIDGEAWTVYDDLVVARASDEASPGRDTLVAYSLSDLGEAWSVPFDAGVGIQHVKACGEHLVCAAVDHTSADDGYKTIAFDTATGDQVWEIPVDWAVEDHWYTGANGLVFGDQVFDTVSEVQVRDFAGQVIVEGELFTSALAVRGDRVALETSDADGWSVSIMDMDTRTQTAPASAGADVPEHVSLFGDLVVVLGGDWKARVYIVPDVI